MRKNRNEEYDWINDPLMRRSLLKSENRHVCHRVVKLVLDAAVP